MKRHLKTETLIIAGLVIVFLACAIVISIEVWGECRDEGHSIFYCLALLSD